MNAALFVWQLLSGRRFQIAVLLAAVVLGLRPLGVAVAEAANPTLLWADQLATASNDFVHGVSADAFGNVYVSGRTGGSLGAANAGDEDAFVRKYSSSGTVLWTAQFGTSTRDASFGVSVDLYGNVYAVGDTGGDLGGVNAGGQDVFIRKLSADGDHLWTRQLGTTAGDYANDVSVDDYGNVYISGNTRGSLVGQSAGSTDGFIVKYDENGEQIWAQQLGAYLYDDAPGVSADPFGNVFARVTLASSWYVNKYDADGGLLWSEPLGVSDHNHYDYGLSADGLGNVYVTGATSGDLGGKNAGEKDAFVSKYGPDGQLIWIRQLGTDSYEKSFDVSVDDNGGVYIAGYTGGVLGDQGYGGLDAFVSKYNADGGLLWTEQLGTVSSDRAEGVATDGLGNVYVAGALGQPFIQFATAPAAPVDFGEIGGEVDGFLAKYSEIPEPSALFLGFFVWGAAVAKGRSGDYGAS